MKKIKYLNDEEKYLIESYSKVNINEINKPDKKNQIIFKKAAKNYLCNQTKMNIRIDKEELNIIKQRAADDGLKYQTYIKRIIHKYLTGQLIEKL